MDSLRMLMARFLLATGRASPDVSPEHRAIIRRVKPQTRTSFERLVSLLAAIDHLYRAKIPGDIVECGVWQGGSMMAAALELIAIGDTTRTLWLYDTFTGMSAPTSRDVAVTGRIAIEGYDAAPLASVTLNLTNTGWPMERARFIQGKVEDTIPGTVPERIALLRLDTDWYESTRHELHHLYPRLRPGGILILDDYGHWAGHRQAIDEYFARSPVFLHRIDYAGRLVVKP